MSESTPPIELPVTIAMNPRNAEDERAEPQHQPVLAAPEPETAARGGVVEQVLPVAAVEARPRDQAVGEDVDQAAEGGDREDRDEQRPAR